MLNRKFISFAISAAAISSLLVFSAFADIQGVSVSVDGKKLETDVNPIITDGRTLVPMRAVFEALGAQIEWDDATKTVTAEKDDTEIKLTVGKKDMLINGKAASLDVPAVIRYDRTLVPVRAVAEALGVEVNWLSDIKTVSVNTKEPETITLFDLNHEEKEIEKYFADEYIKLGWKDSTDGLYTTLYSSMTKANIPLDTLEENKQNGWSEKNPAISLTDESFYEQTKNTVKVFWHPQNTSGKVVSKYTFTVYYVEKGSVSGVENQSKTIINSVANGEKLGITTSIPTNCYVELSGVGDCTMMLVGEVSLKYKDGTTEDFWCGQSLTKGDKWDGTHYSSDFKMSENGADGNVIYNIYSLDGEKKQVTLNEFSTIKNDGWYLSPVIALYCKDGSVIIASADKKDELTALGLFESEEDILVKVYNNAGEIASVHPSQLFEAQQNGYKIYKEPIKVLYAEDGTTYAAGESEVEKLLSEGWHIDKSEIMMTVYAPDETQLQVFKSLAAGYIASGYSFFPITTVYDGLGYGYVIGLEEKENYIANGYFADAKELLFSVYHPDGSETEIFPYQLDEFLGYGWYKEPVVLVYNDKGEASVIPMAEKESYLANGYALSEDDFYRSYFSLTGKVRGLKSDEEKYIASGWKMAPFPIEINYEMRLERANIWSVYSYNLYWHPANVSGKTIETYRIEYYTCTDGEYIKNYEDITLPVENGKNLGRTEFSPSFLVSVPEGCDSIIIGDITVQYDDGKIESFWCGQAVTLYDSQWNGVLYNENFELVKTETKNGISYSIMPVGKTK